MAERIDNRRLAAILCADVAGYSRLMEADEGGTLARLQALRADIVDPAVAAHRGRVVKSTGDGFLAEFGSAVDAVACAVAIQGAAGGPLRLRIGVNAGDVIHEGGDVFGEGVNLAARLEALAEPGGICVSRAVRDVVRGRLPEIGFRDLGDRKVKNLERPVRVYAVGAAVGAERPGARRRLFLLAGAGVVAAATVIATIVWWPRPPLPGTTTATAAAPPAPATSPPAAAAERPRLSIVVLPFANLSDDKEQEYFADGITEDLTTDLSRINDSFVIARNTAFTYKGRAVDVRQVGRELGVRYALEGSVRRAGDQVRINAQLIDAEAGAHLWAERFDGSRADLFRFQGEVTGRIAATLRRELVVAEGARAARVSNPAATDLIYRARAIIVASPQGSDFREARRLLEEALRLDDRSAQAWVLLSATYTPESRFSPTFEDDVRRADEAAARALALDPGSADAHERRAISLYQRRRPREALVEFETALALDRNRPGTEAWLAAVKIVLARPREADPHIDAAMRLSPRDPQVSTWLMFRGVAHIQLGEDEAAVEALRRSVALNPLSRFGTLFYASALALAGRDEEARARMAEFQRLAPGFTLTRLRQLEPSDEPAVLPQRQRIFDGLRRAGMPE